MGAVTVVGAARGVAPMRRLAPMLLAIAGVLSGMVPVAAAASPVVFGTPTADSKFLSGIDFKQPVTVDKPIGRVELLLTIADAIGPTVIEVPNPPGVGSITLTNTLDTSGTGHLIPNTPIVARWRVYVADDPTEVALGPELKLVYSDDRFDWKVVSGDLVRVHWYQGDASFGAKALKLGEDEVRDTSKLLGVTETEPADFFVYADNDPFYDALGPGTHENVAGSAFADIRTLIGLIPPDQIDDSLVAVRIPHEFVHLVFDTAARNPYHFPPRWLNEGLAVYQSQGYDGTDQGLIEDGARNGTLIPLDGLTGEYPNGDAFFVAYAESVSAVDYLVRSYGSDALVKLIRSYADGRTDDEAFKAALGLDMTAFGAAWMADVHAKAPTKYGPQPAAPGPVPAAWSSGGAAGASLPPAAPSGQALPTAAASAGVAVPGATDDGSGWVGPVLLVAAAVILIGVLATIAWRRAADNRA